MRKDLSNITTSIGTSREFEYRGSSGTVSVCVVRAGDYRMESVRNDLLPSAASWLGVSVLDEWGGTCMVLGGGDRPTAPPLEESPCSYSGGMYDGCGGTQMPIRAS